MKAEMITKMKIEQLKKMVHSQYTMADTRANRRPDEKKSGRNIAVEFCEVKLPVNSRIHPGVTLSLPWVPAGIHCL